MSPIAGFTRFRKWQFGKQTVHGTAVAVTRAVGLRGTMVIEPNWTDQEDVDTGSVDTVLPPYRLQNDITATLAGPLTFKEIPRQMAAAVRGGITPSVASGVYTWAHQALSLTATTLDEFTTQWGDDFTADGMSARDGIIETLEYSFDESLGPWQVSESWRWGSVNAHVTPTTGLNVGSNLPLVFGADTQLFLDDTSGGIGGTVITDALHRATITIENTIDQKRFANGSNSRFAVAGWGLSGRTIRASFTFAKTTAITGALNSETVDWLSADPVNRYVKVLVTSPAIVSGSTPYSWDLRLSGTWRVRSDEEIGGNAVITLELNGRYDEGLGYAIRSSVVNDLATLP